MRLLIVCTLIISLFSCKGDDPFADECGKVKPALNMESFSLLPIYKDMSPNEPAIIKIYQDSLNRLTDTLYYKLSVEQEMMSRDVGKCSWCKCGGRTVYDQVSVATISVYRKGALFGKLTADNQYNNVMNNCSGSINGNSVGMSYATGKLTIYEPYQGFKNSYMSIQLGANTYDFVDRLSDSTGTSIFLNEAKGVVGYKVKGTSWFLK